MFNPDGNDELISKWDAFGVYLTQLELKHAEELIDATNALKELREAQHYDLALERLVEVRQAGFELARLRTMINDGMSALARACSERLEALICDVKCLDIDAKIKEEVMEQLRGLRQNE